MSVDICLVSPPQRSYNHHRPPLALMFLSTYLKKMGFKFEIIDPIVDVEARGKIKEGITEMIMESLIKSMPKVIGISCYTPEFADVIDLADRIKKRMDATIVVGGVHPTLRPRDFFYKGSPVDFVVIGEGEITLVELLKAILFGKRNVADIQGIGYFDEAKKEYRQNVLRPFMADLDVLPLYEKINMDYYTAPNPYAIRGMFLSAFYILVGRGCPSQCSFCVSAEMRRLFPSFQVLRCRSAKNVVDEIEFLKDAYNIDSFYFIDDNFTLLKGLVMDICDELERRKIDLLWGCSARVNSLSKELLVKMRKVGCVQIDFGVESGSDAVLARLKKGITTIQVRNIFNLCRKIGIRTLANILINVPGETEEELQETLMLLDEIRPSVTSFNIFLPYLGTEIYNSSEVKLTPEEYYLLGEPPSKLVLNPRFRFAKHSLDFNDFYRRNHKRYNHIYNFLRGYLSWYYFRQLCMSRRKKDYFLQLGDLVGEYFKQMDLSG